MRTPWIWLCGAAVAASGCADQSALERRAAAPPARRLVGTWEARFELERPPVLTARIGAATPLVRGRIALLANRWVKASYADLGVPTNYGTYDINFMPFGFEARTAGQPPVAVAGWFATNEDSVEVILAPDQDHATVAMRGRFSDDSISGTWSVSIARATGGGGRFVMQRARER